MPTDNVNRQWIFLAIPLVILVVAFAVGAWYLLRPPSQRQLAIEQLKAMGAVVTDYHGEKSNVGLRRDTELSKALPLLRELPNMWYFSAHDSGFRDQDFQYLRENNRLELLLLENTAVTGTGFSELANHQSLKLVRVSGCPLSVAGIQQLAVLPSLEHLQAGRLNLSPEHLDAMQLLRVQILSLKESNVDLPSLKRLLNSGGIHEVVLSGTNLTASEIEQLRVDIPSVKIYYEEPDLELDEAEDWDPLAPGI
ncbi:hypothetical protein ACYFX5_05300 [Bremerella sp. T1]|uniref:hypothetical protein n=1 Tax=Bremerella sp. TYQ1 TaxID=3119568 RepID=UPI001CCE6C7D|nr:hypothetical protein [Bremerella volcania]UBM37675.1 hypothetical protein LA756_07245 [Bremerella volcania]